MAGRRALAGGERPSAEATSKKLVGAPKRRSKSRDAMQAGCPRCVGVGWALPEWKARYKANGQSMEVADSTSREPHHGQYIERLDSPWIHVESKIQSDAVLVRARSLKGRRWKYGGLADADIDRLQAALVHSNSSLYKSLRTQHPFLRKPVCTRWLVTSAVILQGPMHGDDRLRRQAELCSEHDGGIPTRARTRV